MTYKFRFLTGILGILLMIGSVLGVTTGAAYASAPYSCTTGATNGSCGPYQNPNVKLGTDQTDNVVQDEWNAGSSEGHVTSQVLSANNSSDWQVTANMTSNGAVMTSPEDQVTPQHWTGTTNLPVPLADYSSIKSTYDTTRPANTISTDHYEFMYDIWLADSTKQQWTNDQEIMVWTDIHNQTPAGSDTGKTWTDPSTGYVYNIWVDTGSTTLGSDSIVSFYPQVNHAAGSVDLYALFNFLKSGGYSTGSMGIDQVTFGVELCTTSGQNETFTVNNYTLTATGDGTNGAPGGGTTTEQAPAVTTGSASGVSSSAATLNGTVNPNGQATTGHFEYGTTTAYGSTTPNFNAGSGTTAVDKSAVLTGLQPSTTYHYRVDATNATGSATGADQTFTTSATGGTGTSVAFDAASKAGVGSALSLSWTHTVGTGTNRAILAEGSVGINGDTNCSQTMTDNGVAMTKLAVIHANNTNAGYTDIWGMANPPSGANTLKLTMSGKCAGGTPTLSGGAESFTGVSQPAPFGTLATAFGSGTVAQATVNSESANNVVAAFVGDGSGGEVAQSPLTSRFVQDVNFNSGDGNSAGATAPGTGASVTGKFNIANDYWAMALVPVQHA